MTLTIKLDMQQHRDIHHQIRYATTSSHTIKLDMKQHHDMHNQIRYATTS